MSSDKFVQNVPSALLRPISNSNFVDITQGLLWLCAFIFQAFGNCTTREALGDFEFLSNYTLAGHFRNKLDVHIEYYYGVVLYNQDPILALKYNPFYMQWPFKYSFYQAAENVL